MNATYETICNTFLRPEIKKFRKKKWGRKMGIFVYVDTASPSRTHGLCLTARVHIKEDQHNRHQPSESTTMPLEKLHSCTRRPPSLRIQKCHFEMTHLSTSRHSRGHLGYKQKCDN